MCLNKRLIHNPKLNPTGFDKPTIKVDCCKCPDCIKAKSDAWFVRSYFEVFETGVPKDLFLITLDFDNDHLPLYRLGSGLIQSPTMPLLFPYKRGFDYSECPDIVPCFDNDEVKNFLSRLRYYVPPFRYLCVSEYGGFLQRPHYHILFIFDRWKYMDILTLRKYISKCWRAGSHTDVSEQSACGRDPLKMVRYIVNYCTKDFSFDLDQKEEMLPYRFRPRILPSGHYGESALGKQITFETIKNCGFVVIDGLKYQIPRYYEQKLCYDYRWSSEEKKAYRPLNSLGMELSKLRHIKHTAHYVKNFFASRYTSIHLDTSVCEVFKSLYPLSPYNGMQWRDVVFDVMSDFERFKKYVDIKDYLYLDKNFPQPRNRKYRKYAFYRPAKASQYDIVAWKIVDGELVEYKPYFGRSGDENDRFDNHYSKDFDLCVQACFLFDLYQMKLKERQLFYKLWKSSENAKKRAWEKIRRNPKLARYLHLKGYDFRKLYHMSYRDYYELNNSNRTCYVQQVEAFED